ncbi:hypothetical protein M5K25_023190 [Dendrobium thyrsiflorum]|uniref:Uncharacterized protein n=1 Tax=Dendrobium thyrsiflorum TaxID=117978 RepID=A0ABD0U7M0_DENTH
MRGVGGPLLCIGDLLRDVADDGGIDIERRQSPPPSPQIAASVDSLSPYDLQQLFQVTLASRNCLIRFSQYWFSNYPYIPCFNLLFQSFSPAWDGMSGVTLQMVLGFLEYIQTILIFR